MQAWLGENLQITFDSKPPDAAAAVVKITDVAAGYDELVGEISGSFKDGKFVAAGKPKTNPEAVSGEDTKVSIEVGGATHELMVLTRQRPNRACQINVEVLVGGKSVYKANPPAVFVARQAPPADRQRITFLVRSDPQDFFDAARVYWKNLGFTVVEKKSLQEIVQTLATGLGAGPKRIEGMWGEVNIVCHGNEVKMHPPITTGNRSWIGSHDIGEAAAAIDKWPKLWHALDEDSYVVIRGCNIGHNQDLLSALKETIFQGCCPVYAPLHYLHYDNLTEKGKLALAWESLWERLYHYHDGSGAAGADAQHQAQFTGQHPTLVWATERASYEPKTYTYGAAAETSAPERRLYDDKGTDYVRYPDTEWKKPVAKETFTASPEEYMNQPPDKWAFGAVKVTATTKTLTDEVVLESSAVPGSPCCFVPGDSRNVGAAQAASTAGWRLPGAADLHAQIEWPEGEATLEVTPASGRSVTIRPKIGKPLTVSEPQSGECTVGDAVVFGRATVTIRWAKEYRIAFNAMSTKCEVRRRILRTDDPKKSFADRASVRPDIANEKAVTFKEA
jgi:hypothetical protein